MYACFKKNRTARIKKNAPMTPRSTKFQPHYRFAEFNMFNRKPTLIVPKIMLCGNWLEKAGSKPASA